MNARRIIGLGQPFAGDDAVGLAVIAHLRAQRVGDIALHEAVDATELLPLIGDGGRLVLVDAVLGVPAGRVEPLAVEALDDATRFGASSHGLGLGQTIALARTLSPGLETRLCLQVVGVGIAMPARGVSQLSPAVRAAIPLAAALALAWVRGATPSALG